MFLAFQNISKLLIINIDNFIFNSKCQKSQYSCPFPDFRPEAIGTICNICTVYCTVVQYATA